MKNTTVLFHHPNIQVRSSPIDGFGVFATDTIKAGEVLEEIPFILFPRGTNLSSSFVSYLFSNNFLSDKELFYENLRKNLEFKEPEKYYFKWTPKISHLSQKEDEQIVFNVLPLGYGPIYNTANFDNNAQWLTKEKTFVFSAVRDIKKDEEIRTFYGYFLSEDGRVWNSQSVAGLALESEGGKVFIKGVRPASPSVLSAYSNDTGYRTLQNQLIAGVLRITSVAASDPEGKEANKYTFSDKSDCTTAYSCIFDIRSKNPPFISFGLELADGKTTNVVVRTI